MSTLAWDPTARLAPRLAARPGRPEVASLAQQLCQTLWVIPAQKNKQPLSI